MKGVAVRGVDKEGGEEVDEEGEKGVDEEGGKGERVRQQRRKS